MELEVKLEDMEGIIPIWTRRVKGIIKFNHLDQTYILYYSKSGWIHRMQPDGYSRRMSTYPTQLHKNWSPWTTLYIIREDEEPLLNGKPIQEEMEIFEIDLRGFDDVRT